MTLSSPVGGRHRFVCHCYNAKGEYTTLASATPGHHKFEVPEGTTRVVYTMQDGGQAQLGQWIWNGESWLSLNEPEGVNCLEDTIAMRKIKKAAKKVAKKPAPRKTFIQGIDSEVYTDAVEYTKKYNKRFTSVKQAFAKVTK